MADLVTDALSRIRNAVRAGKRNCEVKASRLIGEILEVMRAHKYVESFEYVEDGRGGKFNVKAGRNINKCGVIRPRYAATKTGFEKYESRYLPGQDFGILIATTSQGVLSHKQAKEKGIGGRLLAYVY